MSFFGGYSKRGRQLEEQDKKFLEFKKQMSDQNIVFEKGDYLAMVLGAFWALWPALGLYQEGINTKKNSLAANR